MTIGIDARFFGPRGKGLGRYTQKLIESLEEIDQENDYVIFLRAENFDEFQPKNPRFKKVLADYRWYSFAEQIFFPFALYRQGVDLMHFPHFNVPIFYFRPYVVTIHDLILRHFQTRRASTLGPVAYWFKNLMYRLVIWLAVKRARKIITVSNYVKEDIMECFRMGEEKIVVTYEGVAVGSDNPPSPPFRRGAISNSPPFQRGVGGLEKPYLLYVGNAYPHKNLERLIEAFGILVGEYKKDLQLVLVGEDDYFYRRLKKLLNNRHSERSEESSLMSGRLEQNEESGVPVSTNKLRDPSSPSATQDDSFFVRVIFTGFVPDEQLFNFYQNASLYVFPSLCEGFGLPPLEAMSHGVPVVCSHSTCLPEILGEAAIYFDPLNPRDMAEKINQILTDKNLQDNLVTKGLEQIKKYSWERMGEETLKIYFSC